MYYYMNPRRQVFVLQIVIVVFLIVIVGMVYSQYGEKQDLEDEIESLELKCPKCPSCPSCPNLKNPVMIHEGEEKQCPACPQTKCSDATCPSVKDIVSGIFPGRNTGFTSGGRYFDIKEHPSLQLHSEYSATDEAFPEDSILDPPLRFNNPYVTLNDINNSIDNSQVDTNASADLRKMHMGSLGKRTDMKMVQSVQPELSGMDPTDTLQSGRSASTSAPTTSAPTASAPTMGS